MARPAAIRPVGSAKKFIRSIIFAEPGVGKTPFIGTSPKALILDADVGTESAQVAGSNADTWPIYTRDDMTEAHEYLRNEEHGYQWVWLDSASLWQEVGLADIMENLIALKPHRDKYVPDQHQYLQNMNFFSEWMRHMKSLPLHFGMTAHVMRAEDNSGEDLWVPHITGKGMWSKACGHMNLVGYLRVAENDKRGRHWILHADRSYKDFYGKDRLGIVGTMREPTIPKIMKNFDAKFPQKSSPSKKKTKKRRPAKGKA